MTLADIEALPVAEWAAPDCALFLWTTDPSLPQLLEVIASWGSPIRRSRSSGSRHDQGRRLPDRLRLLD
jgi:N6-adenosine-specific RNA methylase IME4